MDQKTENNKKQNNKSNIKDALKHLEQASLSSLILSISSSAIVQMGLEPSMQDKKDLKIAQLNIDLLEILKDKTEGRRTEPESQLLDHCIKDLKLQFVKVQSQ